MTPDNIYTKSASDFLAEKIKYLEYELALAKKELFLLNKSLQESGVINEVESSYYIPSKADQIRMVMEVLNQNEGKWIKTSTIVQHYFPKEIDDNKEFKETITRRFSGTLGDLVYSGKVFNKKVIGERGDLYTISKELLNQ